MIKHSRSKKYKKKHTLKKYKGGGIGDVIGNVIGQGKGQGKGQGISEGIPEGMSNGDNSISQIKGLSTKLPLQSYITKLDITEMSLELIDIVFNKITCLITPMCSFIWVKNKFIYSIKLLNDMLLISGLYFKNLLYLGYDSNLNNILPKNICFDLFDESVCNAKINKLLNMKSKEYNNSLPKELRYLQNMKGGGSKKTKKQKGGTLSKTCKNNQIPGVICYDDRSNINEMKPIPIPKKKISKRVDIYLFNLQKLNLSIEKTVLINKETTNMIILGEIRTYNIYRLYNVLNILKILYSMDNSNPDNIQEEEPQEEPQEEDSTKYKLKKNDILRIEHNFKKYENIELWQQCNELHLEQVYSNDKREELIKKCKIKCNDCTMKKQSELYTPDNTNYNPRFGKSFYIIENILNKYYKYTKINKYNYNDIYILLKDENDRIKLFDTIKDVNTLFIFFNIGEPIKIKDMEKEIELELINISKLNKQIDMHITVSKYLLYSLFNKSSTYSQMMFKNKNLNSDGTPIIELLYPNS